MARIKMEVRRFVNSVFTSNTYVVHDGGRAIVVDMGDFEPVREYVDSMNLNVEALFITHTHYDHIYGVPKFMSAYPNLPIYTSVFGKEAFAKSNWNFSRYHDDVISIESDNIIALNDGDDVSVLGDKSMHTMSTPGHDKSCMTYSLGNMLFTGDSYIPEVKVIASFPNSDKAAAKLWYAKLEAISAKYDVYPGHGL